MSEISNKDNIYKDSKLSSATKDYYRFVGIDDNHIRVINRKNLDMKYSRTYKESGKDENGYIKSENKNYVSKARCKIISENVFFEIIEGLIKSENQGNQI